MAFNYVWKAWFFCHKTWVLHQVCWRIGVFMKWWTISWKIVQFPCVTVCLYSFQILFLLIPLRWCIPTQILAFFFIRNRRYFDEDFPKYTGCPIRNQAICFSSFNMTVTLWNIQYKYSKCFPWAVTQWHRRTITSHWKFVNWPILEWKKLDYTVIH